MADISKEDLRKEFTAILKDADLASTFAKMVRQQLEEKLGANLQSRKKEIDDLVMELISSKDKKKSKKVESEKEEEEEDEGAKGSGKGYTKTMNLSPELAALVGQDAMARLEVAKKVWSIIKERGLYDPKNKQYAICDDALFKVIGTRRFRIFSMMQYLKNHFVS